MSDSVSLIRPTSLRNCTTESVIIMNTQLSNKNVWLSEIGKKQKRRCTVTNDGKYSHRFIKNL